MIDWLYPYLILTGATILGVMLYLWRRAKRASQLSLELIRLNEKLNFDTVALLRAAWPLLSKAGLEGMSWQLDWFGAPLEERHGNPGAAITRRSLEAGAIHLNIAFHHAHARGEARFFSESVEETFLMLLRTGLWIKAGTLNATFAQMSRLTLFLQHDMKNIAQYIQLTADQLQALPVEQEGRLMERLRLSMPLIRQRADRVVRTLMLREPPSGAARDFALHEEITRLCRLYALPVKISGAAHVCIPENALDAILDNLLKNYGDIAQRKAIAPDIHVSITEAPPFIETTFEDWRSGPVPHHERLFEPFWSSDANGLGIGLYQARELARSTGGELVAETDTEGRLRFRLRLPSFLAPPEAV